MSMAKHGKNFVLVLCGILLISRGAVAEQTAKKVFTAEPGRTVQFFKVVQMQDTAHKKIGIIDQNTSYFDLNGQISVAKYDPLNDSITVEKNHSCTFECRVDYMCLGVYWLDIAPYDTAIQLRATWEELPCPTTFYFEEFVGNCDIGGNAPTQNVFFDPVDSTVLFKIDTSGLLYTQYTVCPQKWQVLKAAKNAGYFLIVPENPNILFFCADDTLWHSSDAGNTWNVAVTGNIQSITYYPNTNIFFACSGDSLSGGAYVSVDTGATFRRTDTVRMSSISADARNGAIYACGTQGLLCSLDTGRTFFMYNNVFTTQPLISVAANTEGKLLCAASDGLYSILQATDATYLIAPHNDTEWIPQPIMLQWESAPDARSYYLQLAADSNFTAILLADSSITTSSKQINSLSPNTRYFWRVRTTYSYPVLPVWSQTWSFTTLPLLPTQTELIAPHNDTILYKTRVDFSWNAVQNVPLNYWFEIADNDSLKNSLVDSTLTDTIAALYEPLVTQTYWWRVRGENAAGWGPFSPVYHFTMLGANDVAEMNIPSKSGLIQNYPNPFTSSTLIRIPSQSQAVSLKIYDALGREVADLSAEARSGNTSIPFDGSHLPAGVYVCRMRGEHFVSSKLMVLEK